MPRGRMQIERIEGYQPLVDRRKTGRVGVLFGKNFTWDSSGVRSDFASRLVSGNDVIVPADSFAQSVAIGDHYHLIAGQTPHTFVPNLIEYTGTWTALAPLTILHEPEENLIPEHLRHFTSFFLGNKAYVNSWNTGCYEVDITTDTYTRLTSGTVPGFPTDAEPIYAIAETNGRAVYLSETTLYWSGPGDATDLVPALAGAGFQVLSERVSGEPRVLLPYANGIIIWTNKSALVGEFIGGPTVFRWYQITTEMTPLSQSAVISIPDGTHLAITRLGLFQFAKPQQPQLVSEQFSDFLREYVRYRNVGSSTSWYSIMDNRLFISLHEPAADYIETFALDIAQDKWGVMNHRHRGMFPYGDGTPQFGFADSNGVTHCLLPILAGERTREDAAAPGTFLGLDSEVTIGYIRDEQLMLNADGVQELTDFVVFHNLSSLSTYNLVIDEGELDSGYLTLYDDGVFGVGLVDYHDDGVILDSSQLTAGYKVDMLSDFATVDEITGIDYGVRPASLAHRGINTDTWTGTILGHYLSLRFTATEPGEFFRLNAMDCSLAYAGQVV